MKTSEEALISTSVRSQTFASQRLCVKLIRKQKHNYCSSQLLPALQYHDATPLFELAATRSVRGTYAVFLLVPGSAWNAMQ